MSKPPVPTRIGPFLKMWHDFWGSFSRVKKRKFVGEDSAGNRFYEILEGNRKGNVNRGFEPPPDVEVPSEPPVEWRAWLNKSRRFPPSDEEIQLNILKQQAQLVQNTETEKKAPMIVSTGPGAAETDKRRNVAGKEYPKYTEEEYEGIAGAKTREQLEREQKEGKWKNNERKKSNPT
ncbi:hypothetical protein niasHS_015100 [Heterodera schachtii]|uniref:NADH dehydrogenase [ubiquinone] 1 alpha subcomplex assembly factor 2 n=1 Tax=Heterodera schachtii TaxID=97005 RepID=A0ABD2I8U3_HETSC